jgi:predicted acetyltransferase
MTTPPAGYRLVDAKDRQEDFFDVDRMAFGMTSDPEVDALVPVTLDWDRAVALEDPTGRFAGVHASFPFTMPVPGASVRTSGLTWVGVRPDHRRRGLLQSMIAAHFERSLSRGEPVSALFAAEAGIYGRFGYGSAADDLRLTLDRGTALRPVDGSADLTLRLDSLDPAVHDDVVDAVHRAAGRGRPGWITRDTDVLRARQLVDPPAWRRGGEPLRIVTVSAPASGDPSDVRGYALFRRTEKWENGRPRSTVSVRELAAVDAAATHRLWSFLLDLDLTVSVETGALPVDDALVQLLVDTRSVTSRLQDNVWVRLLDLPAALTGRRYAAPLDVVLAVTDDRLPANAGTWRLRTTTSDAGAHVAEAERTTASPDVSLDVRDLGAAYLGGRSLAALQPAGLAVEHTPGALIAASAAFRWPLAPVCSWGW